MPAATAFLRPLILVAFVAGCGGFSAKLNPLNWFKRGELRESIVLPEEAEDRRPLVEDVLSLAVEPIPGGAIVRARGRAPTQGWWQAELVPHPVEDTGVLVYEFRVFPPIAGADVSTPQSREIDVAIYVSDYKLEFVNEIVVQGANNARTSRR